MTATDMDSINESLPSEEGDDDGGDGGDDGEEEKKKGDDDGEEEKKTGDDDGDGEEEGGSEENTTLRKEKYVRSQSRVRSESYHKYLAEDSVCDENMDGMYLCVC